MLLNSTQSIGTRQQNSTFSATPTTPAGRLICILWRAGMRDAARLAAGIMSDTARLRHEVRS